MKIIVQSLLLCCIMLSSIACGDIDKVEKQANNSQYFNLLEYFNQEIAKLNKQQATINKTIYLNGREETHHFSAPIAWKKELNKFIEADINKPSWVGRYTIDTIQQGQNTNIIYTAMDKDMLVQKLHVQFVNKSLQPNKIKIQKLENTLLYTIKEELTYKQSESYNIISKQSIPFRKADSLIISGHIILP